MAVKTHAILSGDQVVNVIVTDDNTPEGWLEAYVADTDGVTEAVDLPHGSETGVGWQRKTKGKFVRPDPPPEE